MHRCLYTEEILNVIAVKLDKLYYKELVADDLSSGALLDMLRLQDFDEGTRSRKARQKRVSHPVLSFAFTCKTIYWPCMNVLWAEMNDISPLMRLFPPGVCRKDNNGRWTFLRRPDQPRDWERFLIYSPRIENLCVDSTIMSETDLRILASCCPTKDAFRYVRSLSWRGDERYPPVSMRLFVTRALKSMWVLNTDKTATKGMINSLEMVAKLAPKLENLHIQDAYPVRTVGDAFGKAICSTTALTEIDAFECPIPDFAIRHLSKLPNLRTLWCSFLGSTTDFGEELRGDKIRLPSLEHMRVCCSHDIPVSLTSMLKNAYAPKLKNITIATDMHPMAHPTHELFLGLAENPSLEEIHFYSIFPPKNDTGDEYIIKEHQLATLYRLPNLTHVALNRFKIDLRSSSIASMAEAWPNMVSLDLGDESGYKKYTVSLQDLQPLATKCRKLRALGILVDASHVSAEDVAAAERNATRGSAKRLLFGTSPIKNPQRVAKFILCMFPHATIMTERFADAKKWEEVNWHLERARPVSERQVGREIGPLDFGQSPFLYPQFNGVDDMLGPLLQMMAKQAGVEMPPRPGMSGMPPMPGFPPGMGMGRGRR